MSCVYFKLSIFPCQIHSNCRIILYSIIFVNKGGIFIFSGLNKEEILIGLLNIILHHSTRNNIMYN